VKFSSKHGERAQFPSPSGSFRHARILLNKVLTCEDRPLDTLGQKLRHVSKLSCFFFSSFRRRSGTRLPDAGPPATTPTFLCRAQLAARSLALSLPHCPSPPSAGGPLCWAPPSPSLSDRLLHLVSVWVTGQGFYPLANRTQQHVISPGQESNLRTERGTTAGQARAERAELCARAPRRSLPAQ